MTPSVDLERPLNAMTVDVEDYFQVQAFSQCIRREDWDNLPCHVEANTRRILEMFARCDVRATFFTLGWIGKRYPSLVRAIVAGGHELASHGYGHQLVGDLSPDEFRADLSRAKQILEDAGGVPVQGYRAPTFSIGARTPWAFDILQQTGHRYSSSIYPIRHDLYGSPEATRVPHHPAGTSLLEIPMTTLRLGRRNLPLAGGGYFRLLPYSVYRAALNRFRVRERRSSVFYFHPWEIDTRQPKVAGATRRAKFRHYVNIAAMPGRLERLLRDFRWGRMDQVFASELASTP